MDLFLKILEVSFWSAIAATGFGILFNVPKKAIFTVFILGFGAGFVKFIFLKWHINVSISSFCASFFVGILSLPLAHKIHQPPVVFSIPAVIPMIPGYFAYETVLSIMDFIFMETDPPKKLMLIDAIFSNGFNMFFILMALTMGVSLPLLLLKANSVKHI